MVDYSDLIGLPFEIGGRGPDTIDCYGLVMEMSRRNGIELPDFGFHTGQAMMAAMMGASLPQWEKSPEQSGAVVLIRVGRYVSHVGYMIDDHQMIHAWEQSNGVSVVSIDSWRQRIVGFYKYVGI